MNKFKLAVYIGRFQPFHNGHLETLKQGLAIADKVVMVLGSYKKSHSYKNPFSFEERVEMIKSSISQELSLSQFEMNTQRAMMYGSPM